MATRYKIALVGSALSLFMFITLFWMQFGSTEVEDLKKSNKENREDVKRPSAKLKCEIKFACFVRMKKNESMIYNYESQTSIWEKSGGIIYVSASVSVYCFAQEPISVEDWNKFKLGYLIEIVNMNIELQNTSLRRKDNIFNKHNEKSEAFEYLLKSIFIPTSIIEKKENRKNTELNENYSIPFVFFQYENGSFADIFFLNEDNVESVRNFKRHLVYTLVTHLNENITNVLGETPYGYQKIQYSSESADIIAREIFGWKFNDHASSKNTIIIKHWIDSNDNVKLNKENKYKINDKKYLDFWYAQVQFYRNGRLIETKGRFSHILSKSLGGSPQYDIEDDKLIEDFKVQSLFVFKLHSLKQLSVPENINMNYFKSQFIFDSSSLLPEYDTESQSEMHLNAAYLQYKENIDIKMEKLFDTYFSNTFELSKLLELINLEISLGYNYKTDSISNNLKKRLNESFISRACSQNHDSCSRLFQLYSLIAGKTAENMLISYIRSDTSSELSKYYAINSLVELQNPTIELIHNILSLIKSSDDENIIGTLIINLGIISKRLSIPEDVSTEVAETFLYFIENMSNRCTVTPLIMDAFVGLGNLHDTSKLHKLISRIESCMGFENYQIVALNSLRQLFNHTEVQNWLLKLLYSSSCKIKSTVIKVLLEECDSHYKDEVPQTWPQVGFNEVDELLHFLLISKLFNTSSCPSLVELYEYFEKKMYLETNSVFKNLYYINNLRKKRSINLGRLDQEICVDKTNFFENDNVISNNEIFTDYKYQKHCYSEQVFGKSKLNAVYTTETSVMLENDENYIIRNKLGTKIDILGRSFDMGTVTIYNFNGSVRVYHTFEGDTRVDIISQLVCQIGVQQYPYFYHIPLYTFPIGIVQISFGIHVSGETNVTINCPEDTIYHVQPVSKTRIALEGIGIIPPSQAAINIGATFNIHMDSYLEPIPHLCVNSSIGYEPMIISAEAWFLSPPSPRQNFTPEFLRWEIGESKDSPWTEFCLDPNASRTTTSEMTEDVIYTETGTTVKNSDVLSEINTSAILKTKEKDVDFENSLKYDFD